MICRSRLNHVKRGIGITLANQVGIHWFRRDLRIAGNPALQANFKKNSGRVLGLFCFDPIFLSRSDFSSNRFGFFLRTLSELRSEFRGLGGDLLVVDQGPDQTWNFITSELKNDLSLVTWCRDYEPFAVERDLRVSKILTNNAIKSEIYRDHLLIEPQEIFQPTDPSKGYQVFSPFARKWLEVFKTSDVQARLTQQLSGIEYLKRKASQKIFSESWTSICPEIASQECLEKYIIENKKFETIDLPAAGSNSAFVSLQSFKDKVKNYDSDRDFPAISGTSQFSMFLKNGSLTTSQIISFLNLKPYDKKAETGEQKFLNELIWREFYYHILYRNPRVEKEAFIEKFKNIQWENSKSYFDAWKDGVTGFPIVDAGMRELKQTGWMHNRVRMIVASFLTKDLLIDWRWGENYFMKMLLDGDLAPNNGGWQWAASTGCDPQPYFRIFNPWLQSEKFDKSGEYIKKFIPELRHFDAKLFHSPPKEKLGEYPLPIVDHSIQRNKALALYSA